MSAVGKITTAVMAGPLLVMMLLLMTLMTDSAAATPCAPSGPALTVDPKSVPDGPIAGYDREQLVNAAYVMLAAKELGLSARDQQIGVMTAMGESSLRVIDYGDKKGPDSRGLFQQRDNGAWGTYADRMDPFISSTNFFKALMKVDERDSLEPTLVAHKVQRNSDPWHYTKWWEPAGTVARALGGVQANPVPAAASGTPPESPYTLGNVRPQTAAVANTVGPMFGIKTIWGYRPPKKKEYDPQGHPAGLALDFMTSDISNGDAAGQGVANYLQANAATLGVRYVIWQQHIWSVQRSDEGWRLMEDRGNSTANHYDHVHVSLTGDGSSDVPNCDPAGNVTQTGWAAPASGPMSSAFGLRESPGGFGSTQHLGIDLAPGCRKPIWAANKGTVERAGAASGYGNLIQINHGEGIVTRYGHMYADGIAVKIGDQVEAGQMIAVIGRAGKSTGCHVHFEVLQDQKNVDPQAFLDKVGVTIKQ